MRVSGPGAEVCRGGEGGCPGMEARLFFVPVPIFIPGHLNHGGSAGTGPLARTWDLPPHQHGGPGLGPHREPSAWKSVWQLPVARDAARSPPWPAPFSIPGTCRGQGSPRNASPAAWSSSPIPHPRAAAQGTARLMGACSRGEGDASLGAAGLERDGILLPGRWPRSYSGAGSYPCRELCFQPQCRGKRT